MAVERRVRYLFGLRLGWRSVENVGVRTTAAHVETTLR